MGHIMIRHTREWGKTKAFYIALYQSLFQTIRQDRTGQENVSRSCRTQIKLLSFLFGNIWDLCINASQEHIFCSVLFFKKKTPCLWGKKKPASICTPLHTLNEKAISTFPCSVMDQHHFQEEALPWDSWRNLEEVLRPSLVWLQHGILVSNKYKYISDKWNVFLYSGK